MTPELLSRLAALSTQMARQTASSRHDAARFLVRVLHFERSSRPICWWSVATIRPNKSPEPTAIGRFSLFIKVQVRRVAVTRWLSFLR